MSCYCDFFNSHRVHHFGKSFAVSFHILPILAEVRWRVSRGKLCMVFAISSRAIMITGNVQLIVQQHDETETETLSWGFGSGKFTKRISLFGGLRSNSKWPKDLCGHFCWGIGWIFFSVMREPPLHSLWAELSNDRFTSVFGVLGDGGPHPGNSSRMQLRNGNLFFYFGGLSGVPWCMDLWDRLDLHNWKQA